MGEAKRRHSNGAGGMIPPVSAEPMTAPYRKIMICVPTFTGKLDTGTVMTVANASLEVAPLGWQTVLVTRAGDSILPRCRDVLLSQFWYSDCTDMLFLDSDISCDPGNFVRLMSHPVEMIGGVYRGRGDPPAYVCCGIDAGQINVNYPAGIGEVRGIGTGFLRITRAAVGRLIRYLPDNHWYHDDFTAKGMKIYHFFNFVFDFDQDPGMRLRSEDYAFCDLFRAAGGQVWADVELTLHHTGMQTFTGHFGDFLKAGGGRVAPAEGQAAAPGIAPMTLVDAVQQMIA